MYVLPYSAPLVTAPHIPAVAAVPTTHPIPKVAAHNSPDTAAPATAQPVPMATEVPTLQASASQAIEEHVRKQVRYKEQRNKFFILIFMVG